MNIIISGYGKMGKEVEKQAHKRGHHIVAIFDHDDDWEKISSITKNVDVIIDFSYPSTVLKNIEKSFSSNIPIVVGTTGWYNELERIKTLCEKKNGSLFYAPNFSIGMNIFFEVNKKLIELMNDYPEYQLAIEEHHHINKKDAPSGTAVHLAQQIIDKSNVYNDFKLVENSKSIKSDIIPVNSIRKEDIKGTHIISYTSPIDQIIIQHKANSRDGFSIGAIKAAEFLADKKGVYTMENLLFNNY